MAIITHEYVIESAPQPRDGHTPSGWFVLRVPIREERRALDQLKQLPNCDYLILWDNTTRHYNRSRKRLTMLPLLPGYIFVRSDHYQRHELFDALRPVQELTDMCDQPQFTQELHSFCQLISAAGGDITQRKGYAQGTLVEVMSGPLQGCRGRVIRENGVWEITVGLSILGTVVASRIEITTVQEVAA